MTTRRGFLKFLGMAPAAPIALAAAPKPEPVVEARDPGLERSRPPMPRYTEDDLAVSCCVYTVNSLGLAYIGTLSGLWLGEDGKKE